MNIEIKTKASKHSTLLLWDALSPQIPKPIQDSLLKDASPTKTLGLMDSEAVGLFNPKSDSPYAWLTCAGQFARQTKTPKISVMIPKAWSDLQLLQVILGLSQGSYQFTSYKTNSVTKTTQTIECLNVNKRQRSVIQKAIVIAESLNLGRDLVNTPAMDMGPEEFEKTVKKAARGSGLKIKVLEEKDCKDMGMGCLTAVGAGSHRPSKMLILDWKGTQKAKGKTSFQALCGKGICFDTGGLNVKPDKSMLLMRKDMGGAATVAAAMIAIAKLNGEKAVRAYLPLAENALGPEAFRPGDILTACDGTTVEIGHTDAEGRLVLADAIALAVRDGAKSITSVATLTGAALVALGRIHVPVMGDKKEVQLLLDGAQQCGEKAWQLPLEDEHHQMVKGKFADLNNAGNGEAGCITAGAFLKHFAGDTPFAHCDISPASWKPSAHSLGAEGATGTWINTLISTFGNTWDVPSS